MKTHTLLQSISSALCLLSAGSVSAISVNVSNDGTALAGNILGSGVTLSNISYTGAARASGFFSGGINSGIGIQSGIVLTTGDAGLAASSNSQPDAGVDNALPGDNDLNSIISPQNTFDATILEFDFESTGGDLFFNYVFASEEYNEYVGSGFNDVFGFFVDGVNIALVPGSTLPVSVDSVNNGALGDGVGATNPGLFNDNAAGIFNLEYDGFTDVFTASVLNLSQGVHTIKLAIADNSDGVLDSAVFIQANSFSDAPTVPVPAAVWLFASGLAGLLVFSRRQAGK